jgi:hypothetical protein
VKLWLALATVVVALAVTVPAHAANTVIVKLHCDFSHAAQDDPIVFPGMPGAAHVHNFYGNATTDAFSTLESLTPGPSTCNVPGDNAGYWVPQAYLYGVPLIAPNVAEYWRNEGRSYVVAPPTGMQYVARVVKWGCTNGSDGSPLPVACDPATTGRVKAKVFFPDCIMAGVFTYDRACVGGAPIVQLQLNVNYKITDPTGLGLSVVDPVTGEVRTDGSPTTMHADFFNAWDPAAFSSAVMSKMGA